MFLHTHPYPPYIPEGTQKLIVGTLPPPRFTTGEFRQGDVDFCYGSRDGQLWPILNSIFNLDLKFETTSNAVQQRKDFLAENRIGICDIVASARREKVDASDLGMQDVELRDILGLLRENPSISTLLLMGGNSKNGPEYFLRKILKEQSINLNRINDTIPRLHEFSHPDSGCKVKVVSLIAPSGAANRAVGSMTAYKEIKLKHPEYTTLDFRIDQYRDFFTG